MNTPVRMSTKRLYIVGSLLSAVVLAGCVSQSEYDALKARNQSLEQQVASQSAELSAAKENVARLQGAIKYTVNSDLLFPQGGWQLSERGKQIIARMAAKLAPTMQNKLVVNGYTDNTPIGPRLVQRGVKTNQELSQRRADNVMQYLISQGVKADMMSAHGFGAADPIASNNTADGRAKNRRVELELAGAGS